MIEKARWKRSVGSDGEGPTEKVHQRRSVGEDLTEKVRRRRSEGVGPIEKVRRRRSIRRDPIEVRRRRRAGKGLLEKMAAITNYDSDIM